MVYTLDKWELKIGDTCELGSQLRPHIVWFGEPVDKIMDAALICQNADIFVVVGTSLNVYPAAGLIDYVPSESPVFLIDPNDVPANKSVHYIKEKASSGIKKLAGILREKYN